MKYSKNYTPEFKNQKQILELLIKNHQGIQASEMLFKIKGMCENTLFKILDWFEKNEYITKEQTAGSDKKPRYRYRINPGKGAQQYDYVRQKMEDSSEDFLEGDFSVYAVEVPVYQNSKEYYATASSYSAWTLFKNEQTPDIIKDAIQKATAVFVRTLENAPDQAEVLQNSVCTIRVERKKREEETDK